jgi:hypothetical protein
MKASSISGKKTTFTNLTAKDITSPSLISDVTMLSNSIVECWMCRTVIVSGSTFSKIDVRAGRVISLNFNSYVSDGGTWMPWVKVLTSTFEHIISTQFNVVISVYGIDGYAGEYPRMPSLEMTGNTFDYISHFNIGSSTYYGGILSYWMSTATLADGDSNKMATALIKGNTYTNLSTRSEGAVIAVVNIKQVTIESENIRGLSRNETKQF